MKTITVTFEISEERLLECLRVAGSTFNLTMKQDIDIDLLEEMVSEDIANFTIQDLSNFLEEGMNNDMYLEFFEETDEDYEG